MIIVKNTRNIFKSDQINKRLKASDLILFIYNSTICIIGFAINLK